jgi:hypothetical protein
LNLRDAWEWGRLLLLEVLFVCEGVVFLLGGCGGCSGLSGLLIAVGSGSGGLSFVAFLGFDSGVCCAFNFGF